MTEMVACGCEAGKVRCTIHEMNQPPKEMLLTCPTCNGRGTISAALKKAHEEFWCRCGNPSGQFEFFDDGEGAACTKHHYTCRDCGKVLQVG